MEIFSELARCFLPSSHAFLFMWFLGIIGIIAVSIVLEKWFRLRHLTDYDSHAFFTRIKNLIEAKKMDEAMGICLSGERRALPTVLGAGIRKAQTEPLLVADAMAEEMSHISSVLEKRMGYLVMFGNVSTLTGLLGTVFGLIMSFAAVGKPGVAAVEKSSLLATGISTAMNATLVGLSISIPCVLVYSFFRSKVDTVVQEVDRYAVAILNFLNPPDMEQEKLSSVVRRSHNEEEPADTDVTPMLNLMVLLIPFLLTSSEFIKIGTIEMKLPEASGGGYEGGGSGGGPVEQEETKLDMGVLITANGFTLFHYFKAADSSDTLPIGQRPAEISLKPGGLYDYTGLNAKLADLKIRVLTEILKAYSVPLPDNPSLEQIYSAYREKVPAGSRIFPDNESVKIVAQDKIKYQIVISTMDAARGKMTTQGFVPMFPNVSITVGVMN